MKARHLRNALVFSLSACLTLCLFSPWSPPLGFAYDGDRTLQEADGYFKRGLYLEAVGAYREVAYHAPSRDVQAAALIRMGEIYGQYLNDPDSAARMFNLVKENYTKSPALADAYFHAGMVLYEKDRYGEARQEFLAYLEKFPNGEKIALAEFMADACLNPPSRKEKQVAVSPAPASTAVEVRVLLEENRREMSLNAASGFDVTTPGGRRLTRVPPGYPAVARVVNGRLTINGSPLSSDEVILVPGRQGTLKLGNRAYRGRIRIKKNPAGTMQAINILNMEDYLYGVVPREMPPTWSLEALKAQAVVSRTYVTYQMERNRMKDYDICNTTSSQVYGGCADERTASNRAVDETRGKVLTHNGRIALPYFHSNSGGVTEDAKNVWLVDIPYLKTVQDPYSLQAPNTTWSHYLSLDDIRGALARNGVDVGSLHGVEAYDTSPSGRVKRVRISGSAGERVINANLFRLHTDPRRLKSTLFTARRDSMGVLFEGKGAGHGVGMSQWGAYVMAKSGQTYRDILNHYYRGLEVR
ncbi:MAG TPA: SpoIID/LytB domain-containing protein [Syntrophales bacterium]|nr:SpoIID/LytB domain-containing protein [Syntrophales bacterium]HPI58167.1 SpoIID/LytB domain-containing protein [Syntrophales bacterium]HPN25995.1 SpoIID/LytB domain-containing protein [Syntrophales bacterium]